MSKHVPFGSARIQYSNLDSKEIWEKKIKNAAALSRALEKESNLRGLRENIIAHGIFNIDDELMIHKHSGFFFTTICDDYIPEGGFAHDVLSSGGPRTKRIAITKDKETGERFRKAYLDEDEVATGQLLGYPTCCCQEFDKNWKSGIHDPLWEMAVNSTKKNQTVITKDRVIPKNLIRLDDSRLLLNQAFRYIGVVLVNHIPCSYDCKSSHEIAEKWLKAAKEMNEEWTQDMIDVLSLPFEWSSLKGIIELRTPVFKFTVGTDVRFPEHAIQKESSYYPEEAPMGIYFPWKMKMGCGTK